jgi:hypothetical protein
MKARLLIPAAAAAAALAAAGCGGGGDSSSSPAAVAPAKTPVYIEVAIHPEGELGADVNALAEKIAGVDDLGELIVSELEQSALDSGESLDYAKEVEPWLGDKAGIFLEDYDGDDFNGYGIAVQSTDTDATEEFIDKQAKSEGEPAKDGSFEGVDFKVDQDDGNTIGIIDDMLVFAADEATFKSAVEASNGEALADQDSFTSAIDAASSGSFADVFVDIGGLIKQTGAPVDPETELFLESAGLEPDQATAVASLVPGSDQVEVDFSSDVTGKSPPAGDASELLSSLPGGSFAAFASAGFGERFEEAIDRIDASGVPGELEPGELKDGLKAAGIDLESIAASLGDLGVFAQGNTEKNLTGAVVLTTKGAKEATNTVANIGLLLRASQTPGVTALSGEASGFSVRSPDLGPQPLVVAAKGNRIAVSYGLAASAQALSAGKSATLAEDPAYKEAVAALGDTPITGFVDGPAAVQLASALVPADEQEGFQEAKPYLDKIAFAAIGAGSSGERATAKMIVGLLK